jgi:hypothetical protein
LAILGGVYKVTVIVAVEVHPVAEMAYWKVYTPTIRPDAVAVLPDVVVIVAMLGVVPTWVQVPVLANVPTRSTEVTDVQ